MSKKFYVADMHFGHRNAIRYDSRPFADVEQMREGLCRIWNERVGDDDDVYILGDFCWKFRDAAPLLARLRGRKHLILGNHDEWFRNDPAAWSRYLTQIVPYAEIRDGEHLVVLSHYPMMSWNCSMQGSIHFYGHVHATTPEALELAAWKREMARKGTPVRSWNVGVMMPYMQWGPQTLEEICAHDPQ